MNGSVMSKNLFFIIGIFKLQVRFHDFHRDCWTLFEIQRILPCSDLFVFVAYIFFDENT